MDSTQRKHELTERQAAALTKLDRNLQELERYGEKRVRDTIETVASDLDLDSLKSIVFDIESALDTYAETKRELKRLR